MAQVVVPHIPIQAIVIQDQVPAQAHLVVQEMLKVAQVLAVALALVLVQEVDQTVGREAVQAVDRGHLVRYLIIHLSVIRYPATAV